MIDLDDVYSTTFEVRNASEVLTTPASHSCTLTLPDATTVTPTLTVPSTGVLRLDYPTVQEGRHAGYVDTTTPDTRQYFEFDVVVPTFIVSLLDAKAHLNKTATTNDEEIRFWIDVASRWVESKVGPVARRTVVETVTPVGGRLWLQAPVISVTSITQAHGYTATYVVADTYLDGAAGVVHYGAGGSRFAYPVTVTYVVGRAVVPSPVRAACLLMLKALWETQRGPAQPGPFQGSVDEVAELPGMGLAVWRAERLLEPYLSASVVA